MYCSTCGVAIAESLSYCNHCGARIITSNSDKVATSREVKPELLVSAMVATFVLGLVAISVLLGVMKSVLGLELGQILGFAGLSFLILIFLEGVFMLLLFRRNRGAQERAKTESLAGHTTKELDVPQVQALPEPLASVTDQTTRV
jgi:Na+/proline symporter